MPLRLNRTQLALALLALALFVAAIAVLLIPPAGATPAAVRPAPLPPPRSFEAPLHVLAGEAESSLVESNPFDAARRPPVQRRTSASPEEEGLAEPPAAPPDLVLLGTVVRPDGRNIAVLRADPRVPGGAAYHVGEEPMPGWRVVRITREGVTIAGGGQTFELTVQDPRAQNQNPGADEF